MPHPISTHPMNEPGAILAELNALRLLYREAVARLKRARKHTRNAEKMAPREAAEQLGSLARLFEAAYEKHLTGDNKGAQDLILEDVGEDAIDDA